MIQIMPKNFAHSLPTSETNLQQYYIIFMNHLFGERDHYSLMMGIIDFDLYKMVLAIIPNFLRQKKRVVNCVMLVNGSSF